MQVSAGIHMIEVVAKGLKHLREQVVFVGGATMALYIDDPAVSGPRPTEDVDCTVELSSRSQYYRLEEELRELGFKNSPSGPICRWIFSGVQVDVMPSDGNTLGFRNAWYPAGIKHAEKVVLPSTLVISIFSLPYFIASKFEAFRERGKSDFRFSSDFEDIVYVLDGSSKAEALLKAAPRDVQEYLRQQYKLLAPNADFAEGILAHLGNERNRATRRQRLMNIMGSI